MSSLLEKMKAARDCLDYGSKLSDSAAWKDRITLGNYFAGIFGGLAMLVPNFFQGLSPQTIHDAGLYIGWGFYFVWMLVNNYFHVGTSETVGIGKPKGKK